ALVVARRVLDVRAREVDRRHDGAGGGVRALAGVDGAGAEAELGFLERALRGAHGEGGVGGTVRSGAVGRGWRGDGTEAPEKVPEGTGRYRKVPEGTGRYRKVPEGTGRYRKVPEGTGRYRKVPEGTLPAFHALLLQAPTK